MLVDMSQSLCSNFLDKTKPSLIDGSISFPLWWQSPSSLIIKRNFNAAIFEEINVSVGIGVVIHDA